MSRRSRHQAGWITEGSRKGVFQLHWTEYIIGDNGQPERKHRSETVTADRKWKAQERLDEIIGKINPNAAKRDGSVTLEWFTENRWKPLRQWRDSTRPASEFQIGLITARFGSCKLSELDKVDMQVWLNEMAGKYGRHTVWHLRTFLMSICEEAVEQDYITKNQARGLTRPITQPTDSTVLEWSQYRAVIAALDNPRDRLLVQVASACAVRPSELFGFRWRDLQYIADRKRWALEVNQTVYQGKLREYGKTEGSKNRLAVPVGLDKELLWWKSATKFAGDNDYIFPNSKGGFMAARNFLIRVLGPLGKELKLPKLTFQVLRRTFATRAQDIASTTSISRQLRHEKTTTTLENYIKPLDDSVFEMVDAMYETMMKEEKETVQ